MDNEYHGEKAMHPVDHPHAVAFDENRRQQLLDLGKPGDVLLVLFRARRVTGYEGGDRNRLEAWPTRRVPRPDSWSVSRRRAVRRVDETGT